MNKLRNSRNRNLQKYATWLILIAVAFTLWSLEWYNALGGAAILGLGFGLTTDCETIPDYTCGPCGASEPGRIRGIAYVRKGVLVVDPHLDATWETLVGNGDAIMIPFTNGMYDGGKATKADGFGDQDSRSTGRKHQITYSHLDVVENVAFYDAMNYTNNFEIWFVTGTKLWKTGITAYIDAGAPIEGALDSEIVWKVTCEWSYKYNPFPYERPPTVFGKCIAGTGNTVPGSCVGVTPQMAANLAYDMVTVDVQPLYRDFTYPVGFVRVCCPDAIHASFVDTVTPANRPTSLFGGQVSIISPDIATDNGNLVIRVLNTYAGTETQFIRFEACDTSAIEYLPAFNAESGGAFGFSALPQMLSLVAPQGAGVYRVQFDLGITNSDVNPGTTPNFLFALAGGTPAGITLVTASTPNTGVGPIASVIDIDVDTAVAPWDTLDDLQLTIDAGVGGTQTFDLPYEPCRIKVVLYGTQLAVSGPSAVSYQTLAGSVAGSVNIIRSCYELTQRRARIGTIVGAPSLPVSETVLLDMGDPGGSTPLTGSFQVISNATIGVLVIQAGTAVAGGPYLLNIEVEETGTDVNGNPVSETESFNVAVTITP